jgi:hypothetical protein
MREKEQRLASGIVGKNYNALLQTKKSRYKSGFFLSAISLSDYLLKYL